MLNIFLFHNYTPHFFSATGISSKKWQENGAVAGECVWVIKLKQK